MIRIGIILAVFASSIGWSDAVEAKPASAYSGWSQKMGKNRGQAVEYWVRKPCERPWMAPIILVPDLLNRAEHWARRTALMTALDTLCPQAIYAVSLRGRGASDSPKMGWEPENHQTDIATVARTEKIERFHVVGNRVGAGYTIGYGLMAWTAIESLILVNSMPGIVALKADWARKQRRGSRKNTYSKTLLAGIQKEHGPPVWKVEVAPGQFMRLSRSYRHLINRIDVPILVLLGRKAVPERTEDMYRDAVSEDVHWFDSDGDLFSQPAAIKTAVAHLLLTTVLRSWVPRDEE